MSVNPASGSSRCSVTIARGPGGQAEVHKRSITADGAHRLGREATALRRARHPGVVDLVELRPDQDGDGAVLVTRLAGTHTLATWAPPTLEETAGILVALAETLADLHHLGIAHGAIGPEHVVIDAAGRPVLCGFDRRQEHQRTDDVAALGRLARRLLEAETDGESGAGGAPRREPRRRGSARRRLLDLADQASEPDEHARPGARRFAAAVLAAVPEAAIGSNPVSVRSWSVDATAAPDDADSVVDVGGGQLPSRHAGTSADQADDPRDRPEGPTDDRPRTGRPASDDDPPRSLAGFEATGRRVLRTAVAVVGLACLVFGGLTAWTGDRPQLAASSVAAPTPVGPSSIGSTPTGSTPTAPDPAPSSALERTTPEPTDPDAEPSADRVDGSCDAAPATCSIVRPGGVIDHDGQRYALGAPDDELVLADARCTRPPAVALVRPDEGTVYVFDRWARPGDDVEPRRGPDVAVGSHWQPRPLDADGCAELVLVAPGAAPVAVDLGRSSTEPADAPGPAPGPVPTDDRPAPTGPSPTELAPPPTDPGGPR